MIKYDLQYFGGRGASGTLKNPNGKVAKGRNSGESGGGSNSGNDTDALERSLKAEYGNDNVELYLSGKMTYFQLADEIGNSGADLVENLKRQIASEKPQKLTKFDKYANDVRDFIKKQVGVDINKYRDIGADKSNPNNTVHYDNIRTGVVLNKNDISKTDMQRINQLVAKGQIEVSTSGTWILHVRKKK